MSKADPLWLVDISEFQRGLDLGSLKRQGYVMAFIRATGGLNRDGSIYKDAYYRSFSDAARSAGLLQGAYHFMIEKPAKQQVDAFLSVAGTLKDKAIMLDFELYGPNPNLSPSNTTLKAVIAELRSRGIRKPILIYSGKGYWQDYGHPSGPLSSYGDNLVAWDAFYPLGEQTGYASTLYEDCEPFGWGVRWGGVEPMTWQFTGTGRVSGYGGDMDLNAYRGTYSELKSYTGSLTDGPDMEDETRELDDWPEPYAPPKAAIVPVRSGNYVSRHPTRYDWREDIKEYVYRLFHTFRRISINTYVDHPATEFAGQVWGGRDRTSIDIWDRAGRGRPLDPLLGDAILTYLFNDPKPPYIDWIIWKRRWWTRARRTWAPYGTDPFSYHNDHIHCTFVGPQRRR